MLLPQVCRQQHAHVLADDFRRQVSGHSFGGLTELLDYAVLVGHDDGVDRSFEDCTVSALAFHQLLMEGGPLAAFTASICGEENRESETHHEPKE